MVDDRSNLPIQIWDADLQFSRLVPLGALEYAADFGLSDQQCSCPPPSPPFGAYLANVDGSSLCLKAFPGVPELQPPPIRMSSHQRLVRRSRMATLPMC